MKKKYVLVQMSSEYREKRDYCLGCCFKKRKRKDCPHYESALKCCKNSMGMDHKKTMIWKEVKPC